MKLSFHGHDEKYAVEQSMLSLFPGEKPVYSPIQPGEDNWAEVTLHETADRCQAQVTLCRGGRTARQTLDAPLSGDDFQREGIRRRAIAGIGRADVGDVMMLRPRTPGMTVVGGSSDHCILDVEDCHPCPRVGDVVDFDVIYLTMLYASAREDVAVKFVD